MTVGIGNRPPDWAPAPTLAERVLDLIRDHPESTTGNIAAMLRIRAQTPERDELNRVLTALRSARKTKYEHDPATSELRWRLAGRGDRQ